MITVLWTEVVSVSFKRFGWCLWHYSSEAGLTVVQVGGMVIEVSW